MNAPATRPDLLERNRRFYNGLWSGARLVMPELFNTWPTVSRLATEHADRLEIAPGLRPRLPIAGTRFVDISEPALAQLAAHGADTAVASVSRLPFADHAFSLVCALDIIEHVEDDDAAMAEIARVTRPGATLLLSSPLHPDWWTPFDDFVGHHRRYEPDQLLALLARHGFAIQQSAVFGMKPKSSTLVNIGMWFLEHRREKALKWYNRVMPYTVRRQKPLTWVDGFMDTTHTAEALLLCRKPG